MTDHKFRIGEMVHYHQRPLAGPQARGDFRVQALLPPDGAELQYRIKSSGESAERVAREGELSDRRSVQILAEELYTAGDASGVPWSSRLPVIQDAWLKVARNTIGAA